MSAHTPGPWRTTKRNPRVVCNEGGDKWIGKALTGDGKRANSPRYLRDHDQAEANAALMAAAPQMLAALKAILANDGAQGSEQFHAGHLFDARQAGFAAIASAEGRT